MRRTEHGGCRSRERQSQGCAAIIGYCLQSEELEIRKWNEQREKSYFGWTNSCTTYETVGGKPTELLVFTWKSQFEGFLGGAGFRPSTVSMIWPTCSQEGLSKWPHAKRRTSSAPSSNASIKECGELIKPATELAFPKTTLKAVPPPTPSWETSRGSWPELKLLRSNQNGGNMVACLSTPPCLICVGSAKGRFSYISKRFGAWTS